MSNFQWQSQRTKDQTLFFRHDSDPEVNICIPNSGYHSSADTADIQIRSEQATRVASLLNKVIESGDFEVLGNRVDLHLQGASVEIALSDLPSSEKEQRNRFVDAMSWIVDSLPSEFSSDNC